MFSIAIGLPVTKSDSELNSKLLEKSSIKTKTLIRTTNEYGDIDLESSGFTCANTIAVYMIDGAANKSVEAKLYAYNGKLECRILGIDGSVYKKYGVRLKILYIETT